MKIRVHFLPFAGELSVLCGEDPGPFPILFTRVKFTAASLPVRIPFFFPASLALFVCTRCCSENELLGCRWFCIQEGFWGNPALTVDGRCRRVTVKRQVFQEIDIYSLYRPNPSPLPPRLPLLTLPAPITVFLTSLLSTCIVHYIPIVPHCVHYKQHVQACTDIALYHIVFVSAQL